MLKHLFYYIFFYFNTHKQKKCIYHVIWLIWINHLCVYVRRSTRQCPMKYTKLIIKHKIKLKLLIIIDIWINFGRNKFYKRDHTNILMVVCTCLRTRLFFWSVQVFLIWFSLVYVKQKCVQTNVRWGKELLLLITNDSRILSWFVIFI